MNKLQEERPTWLQKFYNLHQQIALAQLKRKVRRFKKIFESVEGLNIDAILNAKSLPEFSTHFSAKLYNYKNSDEYYSDGSSYKWISGVKIPLLVLNAYDDPLVPKKLIPIDLLQSNLKIQLTLTNYGGHLAFMLNNGESWMRNITSLFIDEQLKRL